MERRWNGSMTFIPRQDDEALAMHLYRNADALGVDVDQRARLRQAAGLCQRGSASPRCDTEAGRQDRILAGQMAAQVRDELKRAMDAVIYAAQARGERVVPYKAEGAMRIRNHDGLWTALDAQAITVSQCEIGLNYRALREEYASTPLGSQLAEVSEVRAPSSRNTAAERGLHRAYAGVRVTDAEAAVLAADRSGRSLAVLRAVAGEGQTIRSLGGGGNTRDANLKALRRALDIVGQTLAGNGGLRIRGQ